MSVVSAGDKIPRYLSVCPLRDNHPPALSRLVLKADPKVDSKEWQRKERLRRLRCASENMCQDQARKARQNFGLLRVVIPRTRRAQQELTRRNEAT
jgi:hypothetical protein